MGERDLWNVLGDAIADVRSKLIDEGWFGRRGVTDARSASTAWDSPTVHDAVGLPAGATFEEAWAVREPAAGEPGRAHETGIDR